MKKLLPLASAVMLLSGCASQLYYPRQTSMTFLDFRPYTQAGFFFSADPYPEKYSPVGQLLIEIIPSRDIRGTEPIPPEELLETAYNEAIKRGANGISNFNLKLEEALVSVPANSASAGKYTDSAYATKKASWVQSKKIVITGTLIKTEK